MFKTTTEIKFAFIIGLLILGTFVIFIIAFILFYKKRQNVLIVEKQLKETELENVLLKKEVETIKAIKEERERIGDDLHDDLGSRLSAIRLELEYLQNLFEDKDVQQKMTGVVVQSRELSSIIREVVWSLNAQYDTLDSFAIFVKEYVYNLLSVTKIDLQMHIDEDIPNKEMSNAIRRALFLTIKETLNNALKHSEASLIVFKLNLNSDNRLEISIEDNGHGMDGENQFGNGLRSMQKRIESIGGEFLISNKEGGVEISFSVCL